MKIADLKEEHPAIYELAVKRCGEGVTDKSKLIDGFVWSASPEGIQFWVDIEDKKFQVFYDRYPEYAKEPVKFPVSQPEHRVSNEYFTTANSAEPKAGDMVEFLKWISDNRWVRRDSTHPNKVGQYWSDVHCVYQTPEQLIELFEEFRLHQKSEVESKAKEYANSIRPLDGLDKHDTPYLTAFEHNGNIEEAWINGCKWGQQNPDKI